MTRPERRCRQQDLTAEIGIFVFLGDPGVPKQALPRAFVSELRESPFCLLLSFQYP